MMSEFAARVASREGCAVVVAGSGSDRGHIERIVASLASYGIPCEVRILSAHKSPARALELLREYDGAGGAVAYVAVAGGTDALSGTLSFHALNPVISCPPDAPNESCLRNPPGSSNAYVARPANVGKLIAQIYAPFNPRYREALQKSNAAKLEELSRQDRELREEFAAGQGR